MKFRLLTLFLTLGLMLNTSSYSQQQQQAPRRESNQLSGRGYRPGIDPNIDMYIRDWRDSMPQKSHGSIVERTILTRGNGDPLNPIIPGAVFKYTNRFSYATLDAWASTEPTTLKGEQEIMYIVSGNGVVKWGNKSSDLYTGICLLVPADCEFTITNKGDEPIKMYLVNEPIPEGFRPNEDILVRDENKIQVASTTGHWVHIVKYLFETQDGLGTLERVLTVALDPMTIAHPHSHGEGTEEVWTGLKGESIAFIGTQIRMQPEGIGYMVPPNNQTPHSNINAGSEQIKMFYFARYRDHEVRK